MTLFINIKIVQVIEDVCRSTAQRKLTKIRKHYGIDKYKQVTITEYCEFSRLDFELVMRAFKGRK